MSQSEPIFTHRIRSFIRRQGRLTPGQQHALDHLWERYVLNPNEKFQDSNFYNPAKETILEIGFGNGESLLTMAQTDPERLFIGIEVHRPGVGHLLMQLEQHQLNNVRVYCQDAVEILEHCIPDNSLTGVQLFFPDPWHKTKHHKRRIVRPSFIELLLKKLKPQGYFHAATDWANYAEQMLELLSNEPAFINASQDGNYCERPKHRPLTKFENRGLKLGHGVWDLIFIKK